MSSTSLKLSSTSVRDEGSDIVTSGESVEQLDRSDVRSSLKSKNSSNRVESSIHDDSMFEESGDGEEKAKVHKYKSKMKKG